MKIKQVIPSGDPVKCKLQLHLLLMFYPNIISVFHKKELITSSHTDIFTKTQTLRGLTRIQSQKYEISMIK